MPASLTHRLHVLRHLERQVKEASREPPCMNEGFAQVRPDGGCLRCSADQGEVCRSPITLS
jgi:hypothetical protein